MATSTTARKRAARKQPTKAVAERTAKQPIAERLSAADVIAQAEANIAKLTEESPEQREAMARRERFTAAVILSGYPQRDLDEGARAFVVEHGQAAQTVVSDAEQYQRSVHEQYKAATTRAAETRALMGAYAYGVTSVSKLMSQGSLGALWFPEDAEGARKKKMSNLVEAGRIALKVGATPKQFGEIASLVNKAADKVGSRETLKRLVSEADTYAKLTSAVKRVQTERQLEAAKGKGPNGQTAGTERPQRDADQDVRTWLPTHAEAMTQALVKVTKGKVRLSAAKDGASDVEALRNLRTAIDQYLATVEASAAA